MSENNIRLKQIFAGIRLLDVLLPLSVLSFYLLILYLVLPDGINRTFVGRSAARALLFLVLLLCMYFYYRVVKQSKDLQFRRNSEYFPTSNLWLILLPLTPILRYLVLNQDIVTALDFFVMSLVFGGIALLFVFVLPLLFGAIASRAVLVTMGMSLVFCLFNMASVAWFFHWYGSGSLNIQLALFFGIFAGALILYKHHRSFLYFLVVVYFASNTATSLLSAMDEPAVQSLNVAQPDHPLVKLIGGREISDAPDIFLLTYDAYVENETMLQLGIDNSAQERYLEDAGFKIYRGTYSIGATSIVSMSSALDVEYNSQAQDDRSAASGGGIVQHILKKNKFQTFGVFKNDYFFRGGAGSSYDYTFPAKASLEEYGQSYKLLTKAIFVGEFRYDMTFKEIAFSDFVAQKRSVFSSGGDTPRFLYTHTGPHHSQNSKKCLKNETGLFEKRLVNANNEMKLDVRTILDNNPEAIIVINGDHGPFLRGNCHFLGSPEYPANEISKLDVQDRYGSFLAIRWPDDHYHRYDKIAILQDVFPAVFAYLYKDEEILQSRIKTRTVGAAAGTVAVENGIVIGGADDGENLFESMDTK